MNIEEFISYGTPFIDEDKAIVTKSTMADLANSAQQKNGHKVTMHQWDNMVSNTCFSEPSCIEELSQEQGKIWQAIMRPKPFTEEADEEGVRSFLERPIPGSSFFSPENFHPHVTEQFQQQQQRLTFCNSPIGGILGTTDELEDIVSLGTSSSSSSLSCFAFNQDVEQTIMDTNIFSSFQVSEPVWLDIRQQLQQESGLPNPQTEKRGKKRTRRVRKADSETNEPRRCGNCGTTDTPVFRRDPTKKCLLCNKCALYRRRTGRPRPPLKRKSTYRKQASAS